jgi:serine/threonine-protein kinase HipA
MCINGSVAGGKPVAYRELEILYDTGQTVTPVGVLATSGFTTIFEYEESWQKRGMELSPFKLPVAKRTHQLDVKSMVAGTFGLFADSLPDGWGTLIMDRCFARQGIARKEITPLDRLAFISNHAMGALCYRPPSGCLGSDTVEAVSIGELAREAFQLYHGRIEDAGRLLARIGGSPGGARPKALIGIAADKSTFISGTNRLPDDFTQWLIKFSDERNAFEGVLEFIYHQMAKNAGIAVPEFMLIEDDAGLRHIATRRFDRPSASARCHVATACGLLHAKHTEPSLDYRELLKVAWLLTKSEAQVEEQFRRAAFNLFAANRDDHSKNHSYIFTETGGWVVSPAYDLTFSMGPNGYHWTDYCGEAKNPTTAHLMEVAQAGSIPKKVTRAIIDQVKSAVAAFQQLADDNGVPENVSSPIARQLDCMVTT